MKIGEKVFDTNRKTNATIIDIVETSNEIIYMLNPEGTSDVYLAPDEFVK